MSQQRRAQLQKLFTDRMEYKNYFLEAQHRRLPKIDPTCGNPPKVVERSSLSASGEKKNLTKVY